MYQDLHITLPKELLKQLDRHCKKFGFGRSEFIRSILRDHLEEFYGDTGHLIKK